MKGVNPRVGTGQRLRDLGRFGGGGWAGAAAERSRDRVSLVPAVTRDAAKPLRKRALERKTPARLGTGVDR